MLDSSQPSAKSAASRMPVLSRRSWPASRAVALYRYQHVDTALAAFPVVVDDELLHAVLDDHASAYLRLRASADAAVELRASELLGDPSVRNQLEAIPWRATDRIVAIGDSITEDWLSWSRILYRMLALRFGTSTPLLVNAGVSGDTTADLLARFASVHALNPSWTIVLIGSNDAVRIGGPDGPALLDRNATARNLRVLRDLIGFHTTATAVWVTPPPCDPVAIAAEEAAAERIAFGYDVDALEAIRQTVLRFGDRVVDLFPVFPATELGALLSDGLHPSLEGQTRIVRAVLEAAAR